MPIVPVKIRRAILLIILFNVIVLSVAAAIHKLTAKNTIGNDILVFYLASKSSLNPEKGPYFQENAELSQLLSIGHVAQPGEDYLTFSYPPFALLPIMPLTMLPFDWAQAIWMAFLLLSLVLSIMLFFPKAPKWIPITIVLIYPFSFGLLMGNFVIPIFIILAANLGWFNLRHSGNKTVVIILAIALAWTIVKPQFSWLFIIFILLLAIKNHNKLFLTTFSIATITYFAISFIMWPGWISDWFQQVTFYAQTNQSQIHLASLLAQIFPINAILILQIPIMLLLLAGLIWMLYRFWIGKQNYFLVLGYLGLVSQLFYPGGVAYQQLIFFLPFFVWMAVTQNSHPTFLRPILWATAVLVSWLDLLLVRVYSIDFPFHEWLFLAFLFWFLYVVFGKKAIPQPEDFLKTAST